MNRTILLIAIIVIVFVMAFSIFIILSFQKTALPELEIKEAEETKRVIENTTRQMALDALEQAKLYMEELAENNFSVVYINDILIEARKAFEKAELAEEIQENETSALSKQVKKTLSSLNYTNFTFADTYNKVIEYTDEIALSKEKAYRIDDSVRLLELKVEDYELQNIDVLDIKDTIEFLKIALKEERYNDAEILLEEADRKFEKKKEEHTTLNLITRSGKGLFVKYWLWIVIFLVIVVLVFVFFFRKIRIRFLRKKIKKMEVEKDILISLMKKAQTERFKENKISGLVYSVRMKKYKEKLEGIREELPVLEYTLKKKTMK